LSVSEDVPAGAVPASDVPVSDVPANDVPVGVPVVQPVNVPVSDVPASDVPVSDVAVSDVPANDVPVDVRVVQPVDVPVSDVPASDVPVSDVPVSDVPVSDVPVSDVPASDVPANDVPVGVPVVQPVNVPVSDVPASDVPVSDVAVSDVPANDVPVDVRVVQPVDVPVSDVPASDVPVSDVAVSDVPANDVPVDVRVVQPVDVPVSDVPASDVPAGDVPASDVPVSDVPASDVPIVQPVGVAATCNLPDKRIYNKRHYCLYCKLPFFHLPRHLYSCHSEERDVAEVLASDGATRKVLLTRLRNLGSEQHNLQACRDGTGEITVVYRPTWRMEATDYHSCEWCHGWYRPRQLWRHKKNYCKLKPTQPQHNLRQIKPHWMLPAAIDPEIHTLISGMQSGAERLVVTNDQLMHTLASKLLSRVGHSKSHVNYIRARLRSLARLLIAVRKIDARLKSADLKAILAPKYFRVVVQGVQSIAGYNNETHTYSTPSVAIRLGSDLARSAQILRSAAVEEEDSTTADSAQQFCELCLSQWNNDVGGTARRDLQTRKMNHHLLLPLAADVSQMTHHLKKIVSDSVLVIEQRVFDARFVESFKSLMEAVLALLILFNRRRQGEVSRLSIALYQCVSACTVETADVSCGLPPLEKNLLSLFYRV